MATQPQPKEYIASTIPAESIFVSYTTLFIIAEQKFGDALHWVEIAELNDMTDPWIFETKEILLPLFYQPQPLPGYWAIQIQNQFQLPPTFRMQHQTRS